MREDGDHLTATALGKIAVVLDETIPNARLDNPAPTHQVSPRGWWLTW